MSDWRPYEPSREAEQRAEIHRKPRSCNRHADCDKADEQYRAKHGRDLGFAFHCHDDECEECFGC